MLQMITVHGNFMRLPKKMNSTYYKTLRKQQGVAKKGQNKLTS